MLPALIASFLGRMVVGEAAATATGARAAATVAGSDLKAAVGAVPKAVPKAGGGFEELSKDAIKAAQNAEKLGYRARGLGEDASKAEAHLKGMQAQTQIMTYAAFHAESKMAAFTGQFVIGLDSMAGAVDHMAGPVKSFVALANPAKAAQFELTMKNAHAVVGRELIPVMDAFTRTAQKVGDVMASFEPVVEPAVRAMAGLVDDIGTGLVEAAIECEPEIRLLTDAIVIFAKEAAWASRHLADAAALNFGVLHMLEGATRPEDAPRRDPKRTSKDAAAQEARFVGAKTVADEAIKAALTLGANVESQQLTELQTVNKNLETIQKQLGGSPDERTKVTVGGGDDKEFAAAMERANRRTQTTWKN